MLNQEVVIKFLQCIHIDSFYSVLLLEGHFFENFSFIEKVTNWKFEN